MSGRRPSIQSGDGLTRVRQPSGSDLRGPAAAASPRANGEHPIKVIVIGNPAVGKTTLCDSFKYHQGGKAYQLGKDKQPIIDQRTGQLVEAPDPASTEGVRMEVKKKIRIRDPQYIEYEPPVYLTDFFTIELWDTAGQERYRSMLPAFYRQVQIVVLVLEQTDLSSVIELKNFWIPEVRRNIIGVEPIFIVAINKADRVYEPRTAHIGRAPSSSTGGEGGKGGKKEKKRSKKNIALNGAAAASSPADSGDESSEGKKDKKTKRTSGKRRSTLTDLSGSTIAAAAAAAVASTSGQTAPPSTPTPSPRAGANSSATESATIAMRRSEHGVDYLRRQDILQYLAPAFKKETPLAEEDVIEISAREGFNVNALFLHSLKRYVEASMFLSLTAETRRVMLECIDDMFKEYYSTSFKLWRIGQQREAEYDPNDTRPNAQLFAPPPQIHNGGIQAGDAQPLTSDDLAMAGNEERARILDGYPTNPEPGILDSTRGRHGQIDTTPVSGDMGAARRAGTVSIKIGGGGSGIGSRGAGGDATGTSSDAPAGPQSSGCAC